MSKSKGKKHMSPEALAANRQNAQYSTGPKTPIPPEEMGQRRLAHGLSSQVVMILPWESLQAYKDFIMRMILDLAPSGMQENEAAYRIAVNNWRLRRIDEYEARMALQYEEDEFDLFLTEGPYKLERYQASIYRALAKDEARLATLKAARKSGDSDSIPYGSALPDFNPGVSFTAEYSPPPPAPKNPQPVWTQAPKKPAKQTNLNAWAQSFKPAAPKNGFELQNPLPPSSPLQNFDPTPSNPPHPDPLQGPF